MAKKVVHDILPPDKRSIRNIPIPENRRTRTGGDDSPLSKGAPLDHPIEAVRRLRPDEPKRASVARGVAPELAMEEGSAVPSRKRIFSEPSFPNEIKYPALGKGGSRKGLWISVVIGALVLAFAVSSIFESATVRITPKQADVAANGTFRATVGGEEGTVPFQIVTVNRDATKEVPAASEEQVERKSSGTIIIYNNHSSASQRLVATTRFESGGLVFRIQEAVTVPGMSTSNGNRVPGSVEAMVVADKPGEQYNLGPTDFVIPGFKGDPRYETFFARSKTAMTGGFSGAMRIVAEETLAEAKDELQASLREQLRRDVESQIPDDFTVLEGGLVYSFEDLPQTPGADDASANVNMRGTLHAVIFEEAALAQAIDMQSDKGFAGGKAEIADTSSLGFAINSTFNPTTDTEFTFSLDGAATIVWLYDEGELVRDLAGISRSEVDQVLAKYPSIKGADIEVRPVWKKALPKDPEDIRIERVVTSGL